IAIITQFWKISTHAAGMFGMMTVLLLLKYDQPATGYDVLCWVFALATVLVCISRVYLGIHTVMQILVGSALATGVTMIVFYMFGKGM
ncbi:MAG: phosphatase PAP2 family protein, partial [Bacteroidetes bacterium]|nr:phosphatase PAP2 family protein [Bacteroidota bacterium]